MHRWDRFLFGYVALLLGAFSFDRVLHLEDRFLVLFAALGVAAMVFDCILTAARMARKEKAEEAGGRSRK